MLGQKNYAQAAGLYLRAIQGESKNRWAWQGLGNARFYLGDKADALDAYEEAYRFSGKDEKLKALVEKLEGEVKEEPSPLPGD